MDTVVVVAGAGAGIVAVDVVDRENDWKENRQKR